MYDRHARQAFAVSEQIWFNRGRAHGNITGPRPGSRTGDHAALVLGVQYAVDIAIGDIFLGDMKGSNSNCSVL